MASYQFFIAALVLVWVQQCCCQDIAGTTSMRTTPDPPQLTLTPSESDGNGRQLTIECRASSIQGGETLSVINIVRRLFTSADSVSLAGASALKNEGQAAPTTGTPQGATVSGGIGPTESQKSVTLTMSRANCGDAGTYSCKANTEDANFNTKYYESERNVTIEVRPGNVTATSDPSGTTDWVVNNTLLMRCNGIVGTVKDASQLQWRWQYQATNGFPAVDNWQDYDSFIGDPDTDINTQSPLPPGTSCYTSQISELTRHLTEDDSGRQFRCYVINNGMSGIEFAQVFTVGTVTLPGQGTGGQSPSTGDGSDSPAKADVGAIVGGVIGALIVVVVIIVIVYFLVIRKRRQQDKPDPSKPADEQPPPGYSTGPDPHVAFSQPTRTSNNRFKKDKEDKGWDERDREREYRQKNSEGLHYADLDLVRRPPTDDSEDSYTPRNQPTEYASIRLF